MTRLHGACTSPGPLSVALCCVCCCSAAKGAIDERNFEMLRQAQERKIRGQQAAAVDTRAADTKVRAAEAKAKAKLAREEAEERAARVRQ